MGIAILGDVHTHTLYSRHAYSTIQENVGAAARAGLELLGSTDHLSGMLFSERHLRNYQFFINTEVWPRVWDGVCVLRGCEADIVGLDGTLFGQAIAAPLDITDTPFAREYTLFDRVTRNLDYIIASVHARGFASDCTIAQATDMYVSALEQEKVFILGHTGRSGIKFDLDTVLTCAKERHKLIEINEHSLESGERHQGTCRAIAERCAELGVGIAVSSDAHVAPQIGAYPVVTPMLEEIHFPEELIVNRGKEPFLRELAVAGVANIEAQPLSFCALCPGEPSRVRSA